MKKPLHIGIDIGGSKIAGILLDRALNEIVFHEVPVRERWRSKDLVRMIKSLANELLKRADASIHDLGSIGYGIPGIVNEKGMVLQAANIKALVGVNVKRIFPSVRSSAWNDAECACYAESCRGNLRSVSAGVHVTLGSGLGGAWLARVPSRFLGKRVTEIQNIEIGHIAANIEAALGGSLSSPYELEDYCSKKFFEAHTKRKLAELYDKRQNDGRDEEATRLFIQYGANVGSLLSTVDTLFRPDAITLSGGMTRYYPAFHTSMTKVFKERRFFEGKPPAVLLSHFGEKAGALGAALYGSYLSK